MLHQLRKVILIKWSHKLDWQGCAMFHCCWKQDLIIIVKTVNLKPLCKGGVELAPLILSNSVKSALQKFEAEMYLPT